MRNLICLAISIFFYLAVSAQDSISVLRGKAKIIGRVIDADTKKGIEYATITLFRDSAEKPVNGALSNSNGDFLLSDLRAGRFKIVIDFVGYEPNTLVQVVGNKSHTIDLGDIRLSKKGGMMQNIVITGQKPIIVNKIDKLIYNVANDITSQGGVATDVLKKIPQVSVDVDGNVELQGNSNIRFLINGKPSSIFGNSVADALQAIPSSQIESIEVITSPGARYDAEGTGGIINIILKKSTVRGINGNISLAGGTRLQNGSINVNAKAGKFGMNAFFGGNAQLASTTNNGMERQSADKASGISTRLVQDGSSRFNRHGQESGLGFEWNINQHNDLTGAFSLDNFSNKNRGLTNQQLIQQDDAGNEISNDYSVRNADNRFSDHSFDWNLDYKKSFRKENRELDISYSASRGESHSYYHQFQTDQSGNALLGGATGNNPGTDRETNIEINYTEPVSKTFTLETGLKSVLRSITSKSDIFSLDLNSSEYVFDTLQSYSLHYDRNIYAAYVSGTFSLFHFLDMKMGGRYEYTNTKADFSNAGKVTIPAYNTFAPSIVLSHSFEKDQTLKLSYTHRIQRPGFRSLNPFVNSSDPKNISAGNPNLRPEIGDNFELGYNKSFENNGNIYISLFYRRSDQDIQPYIVYYPSFKIGDSIYTNVSVTTSENIGLEHQGGLNIYGSIPLTSKFKVRTNLSLFDKYIVNRFVPGNSINSFNYRINLNASYEFDKGFIAEFFGNFRSARTEVQGRYPSFTTYNFAFRKQILRKKGTIGFTTTNPFNKYVDLKTHLTGTDFILSGYRQIPFRSFGISFTLRFGKLEFKKKDDEENIGNNLPRDTNG